jgi:hypothetical protein
MYKKGESELTWYKLQLNDSRSACLHVPCNLCVCVRACMHVLGACWSVTSTSQKCVRTCARAHTHTHTHKLQGTYRHAERLSSTHSLHHVSSLSPFYIFFNIFLSVSMLLAVWTTKITSYNRTTIYRSDTAYYLRISLRMAQKGWNMYEWISIKERNKTLCAFCW